MKSLKIIQVLAMIARVVCLVLFILFIIGAAGCFIGTIVLPIIRDIPVNSAGKTFSELLVEKGTNLATLITGCVYAMLSCGVGIFLAKYTELFFIREIKVGTPFTKEVARDMRIMAIVNMAVGFGSMITLAIAVGIAKAIRPEIQGVNNFFTWFPVGFGLAMLVISLFCDYGAELQKPEVLEAEIEEEPEPEPEEVKEEQE